ncbi:hypothetical protein DICPUDRAFT_153035 [Dictyostelium purpureum]|uniref:tRNA (guanosine(18)-2'-O)-methyltransferase TARBP1 n=1 Tax=Dictyostelium purpureum TaxID=5786 RepID=F0ZMW8_DICPU|nr:uncharacterized protein DICPUDRAFT_153035 [Dictyostelium purpureum]EGC34723.1 hypothetical protein DICPUDRAFT_153035 [Dictyostelium purpureum]|eukprot:XP_003288764.1 hypothetical protein DICPUDRAFT_153035 [Dictyostelium purpureum]
MDSLIIVKQLETFSKSLNNNSNNNTSNENEEFIYNSFLDCVLINNNDNNDVNNQLQESLIERLKLIINSDLNISDSENHHLVKLLLLSIQRISNNSNTNSNNNENIFNIYFNILQNSHNVNNKSILDIIVNNIKQSIITFIKTNNNSINSDKIVEKLLEISNSSLISLLDNNSTNNNNNTIEYNINFKLLINIYNIINQQQNNEINKSNNSYLIILKYKEILIKNSIDLIKLLNNQDAKNLIVSQLIISLVGNSVEHLNQIKEESFKMLDQPDATEEASRIKMDGYRILSGFLQTFPSSFLYDERFWKSIISGLVDMEPLNRKRSNYLLKKSISISISNENNSEDMGKWTQYFEWNKENSSKLQKLWNTFFLINESLDDFTIHTIEPVWKELDQLVVSSSSNSSFGLHFDWLNILFKRGLQHMNPAVIKILVLDVLYAKHYIPYLPLDFVTDNMIHLISTPLIYKGSTEGSIHAAIQHFFTVYYESLKETEMKIKLFRNIITILKNNHFHRDLVINLIKFIEVITNKHKEQVPVVNNEFFPIFNTLFELSIKRLHSNGRNRLYKSVIKSLQYITDEQLSFDNMSKIIFSIPFHFHSNPQYNQLISNWLNGNSGQGANKTFNSIMEILKNHHQQQSIPNTSNIDKDFIVKLKSDSFISARIISYLKDEQFSGVIKQILDSTKQLIENNNTNSVGFFYFITLLGSILSIINLPNQIQILNQLINEIFSNTFMNYLGESFKSIPSIDYAVLLEVEESYYLIESFILGNHSNLKNKINEYFTTLLNSQQINNNNLVPTTIENEFNKIKTIQRFYGLFKDRACSANLFTIEQFENVLDRAINIELKKPKQSEGEEESVIIKNWGTINSYFIKIKWYLIRNLLTCLLHLVKSHSTESKVLNENSKKYLEIAIESLGGSNFYCSQPIIHSLTILLPLGAIDKKTNTFDQELFERALSYTWTSSVDCGILNYIGSFVQLAFQHNTLSVHVTQEQENDLGLFNHHTVLKEYFYKLLEYCNVVPGIYNLLVMKSTMIWREYPEIAIQYIDEIYEALIYGPIRVASNDLHQDENEISFYEPLVGIPSYVFNLHQDSIVESQQDEEKFGFGYVPYRDSFGRAATTIFINTMGELSQQKPSSTTDEHKINLYKKFINLITIKFLDSNFYEEFLKKKEYILNTFTHRLKIRIWQTLCVLSKFINTEDKEMSNQIGDSIVKVFFIFHLPSVRKYINIFLVNLIKSNHEIVESHLLKLFDNVNLRGDILSSITVTAAYVLINIENNDALYQKVFNRVLSLCVSGHIIVKTIASSVISQLIENDMEGLKKKLEPGVLEYLDQLNYFFKTNSQAYKLLQKQKKQMDIAKENQFTDCAFLNLFYETPVIEKLAVTEIIPPGIFDFLSSKEYLNQSILEKQLRDQLFEKSKLYPKVDDFESEDDDEDVGEETKDKKLEDVDEYIDTNPTSYQKKILPWADLEYESRSEIMTKSRQSVILVASFVDKIPNLAGLVRTSEIFNIECLVVSDMKILNDTAFQQITVTAEKWLPMEEVPEESLKQYLLGKKSQGYSLLGIEQTSSSVQLNKFDFPEKSVLVLGKEKEGIPTEFINLLDKCIEIPQLGVIRSLNVHVSGSILMWEYTKQKLNQ